MQTIATQKKSVLVIGCGSIGERHVRCFLKTGRATVTAFDLNQDLLDTVTSRYDIPAAESPVWRPRAAC
jgi:siroheme synthase (precorrin-2 oxidase/ferrochelatase)